VLNAIETAARADGAVDVTSSFPPPEPMEWAL
jgi:hypothetical protein